MEKFNQLPESVQTAIKSYLKAYDDVSVSYENGMYLFDDGIKKYYAADYKFIGTYRKEQFYTEKEQIENYINEFHDYPVNYKGSRDYALMHKMQDETRVAVTSRGTFITRWVGKVDDNGNFVLTDRETIRI